MRHPRTAARCALLLLASTTPAVALPSFPNIGYVVSGYNAIIGNVLGAKTDMGWRLDIFALTYTGQQPPYDNKFQVPDYIHIVKNDACDYTSSGSETLTNSLTYQAQTTAATYAGVAETAFAGIEQLLKMAGTASTAYQTLFPRDAAPPPDPVTNYTVKTVTLTTTLSCQAYSAQMESTLPNFTSTFLTAVAQIDPSNSNSLATFVDNYGTNYVSKAYLGGTSYFMMTMNASDYNTAQFDVSQMTTAMLLYTLSDQAPPVGSPTYSAYNAVANMNVSINTWGIPSVAPHCSTYDCDPSVDAQQWQQLVQDNPMPQAMEMQPITALLTAQYFPSDPLIAQKQAALMEYLNYVYCNELSACEVLNPSDGQIAYFTTACPQELGWVDYKPAQGRLILSVDNGANAGVQVGTALYDGEGRTHSHTVDLSFPLPSTHIGENFGGRHQYATFVDLTVTSGEYYSNYPYVQLNVCRYDISLLALNATLAIAGSFSTVFYDPLSSYACPGDYEAVHDATGYFMVPSNATANDQGAANAATALFAGTPLTHTHGKVVHFETYSQGTYEYCVGDPQVLQCGGPCSFWDNSSTTDVNNNPLPYMSLLTCSLPKAHDGSITPPQNMPPGYVMLTQYSMETSGQTVCPPGWQPIGSDLQSRLVVATPEDGHVGYTWGDSTQLLTSRAVQPTHNHSISGILMIQVTDLSWADGDNCGGLLAPPPVPYYGWTTETQGSLPYYLMQACVQI